MRLEQWKILNMENRNTHDDNDKGGIDYSSLALYLLLFGLYVKNKLIHTKRLNEEEANVTSESFGKIGISNRC